MKWFRMLGWKIASWFPTAHRVDDERTERLGVQRPTGSRTVSTPDPAYRLRRLLSEGSRSTVWEACTADGVGVVLKRFSDVDEGAHEYNALLRYQMRGVVKVIAWHPASATLVLELLCGARIGRTKCHTLLDAAVTGVTPRQLARVLRPAVEALAQIHAGNCVVGDVSNSNFVLGEDGEARLIDFEGLLPRNSYNQVLAKDSYVAPEQREGLPLTPAMDVYALCVCIWRCLQPPQRPRWWWQSVRPVWSVPTPAGVRALREVCPDLAILLERGLFVAPDDRPSVDAIAVAFAGLDVQVALPTTNSSLLAERIR